MKAAVKKARPARADNSSALADLGQRLNKASTAVQAGRLIAETADALCGWDAFRLDLFLPGQAGAATVLSIDTIDGRRTEIAGDRRLGEQSTGAPKSVAEGAQLTLPEFGTGFTAEKGNQFSPSLMSVPVRRDSEVIGGLHIRSRKGRAYSEKDLRNLQSLADYCGGTLERICGEQENQRILNERLQELERLNAAMKRELRERTGQVEVLNKELEAFSYSISHDLRAPLRSIRGFSEVLLERYAGCLDARGQEYLQRACAAGQQMDKLLENLLELSRVGRVEMNRQDLNLSAMAGAIAAELRNGEPHRHVEFAIARDLSTRGDERLIRCVLKHLLSNAWKFTGPSAHARIEVGTEPEQPSVFYVRDNGVGFDPANSGRLFGVFQRLHSVGDFPGTGIGLAIVQRIVNRHGGRVWASGALGKGATFYFSLPGHDDY